MAQIPVVLRHRKLYKARLNPQPKDYKSLYRFSDENVTWVSEHFLGVNLENRGGALTTKQKMQVFLRYMADPGYQSGIAQEMNIHQTTVCKTVDQVANAIIQKSNVWIKFPSSPEQIVEAKNEWQTRFQFPTCIGVVDCTHIKILKPKEHGDEYINRKQFASLNVQCTCNAK